MAVPIITMAHGPRNALQYAEDAGLFGDRHRHEIITEITEVNARERKIGENRNSSTSYTLRSFNEYSVRDHSDLSVHTVFAVAFANRYPFFFQYSTIACANTQFIAFNEQLNNS